MTRSRAGQLVAESDVTGSLRRRTIAAALISAALPLVLLVPSASLAEETFGTCEGRDATVVGTNDDDILDGTPGDDVIVGLRGADTIYGFGGNDIICGGKGRDFVAGGRGNDVMRGGPGRDTLSYAAARGGVVVHLGDGLAAGEGEDELSNFRDVVGSPYDDLLTGDRRNNRLDGGMGDGEDFLAGGRGDDRLLGNRGDDELRGGKGADVVDDSRRLAEGVEPDTGVDVLVGGPGPDRINAIDDVEGNDDVHGGRGRDACRADDGDTVAGCE